MKDNLIFKLLCSYPVILITLYFLPFLGICLILFRFYMYSYKIYKTSISITVIGVILMIPHLLDRLFNVINFDSSKIPYFDKVVDSKIYLYFIRYSKFLVTVGIIILILSFIVKSLLPKIENRLERGVKDYIANEERKDREIAEKNDLIVRERQREAENTHVVKCPNCGAYNTLKTTTGVCDHCRRHLEYKG